MLFSHLPLVPPIHKALEEEGYKNPTPIQEKSIPLILAGKDLLGIAQTGTGKTAAFSLPILNILSQKPRTGGRQIRSLIVTPTRELALQIGENLRDYGRHLPLKSAVIFGGVNQGPQVKMLSGGIDILVATPGRLLDLISQKHLSLAFVEILVLDEADRMLDMGFIRDIKKLLTYIPKKRQTLFFSATMPKEIAELSSSMLSSPEKVTVTPASSTVDIISQHVYFVDKKNKPALLKEILQNPKIKSVLVFARTKHGANKIVKTLLDHNIRAEAIHGNKSQAARERALSNFKAGSARVLVATDIAARGIDVDNLEYVINYELPNIPETYVHRIGRTGRAGAKGTAFSFCDAEEVEFLDDIEKLISKSIPVVEDHTYHLEGRKQTKKESASQGLHKKVPQKNTSFKSFSSPASKPREKEEGKKVFKKKVFTPPSRRPAQGEKSAPLQKRDEKREREKVWNAKKGKR
jgi:ATP-dependent RNA helicase RhlE